MKVTEDTTLCCCILACKRVIVIVVREPWHLGKIKTADQPFNITWNLVFTYVWYIGLSFYYK